MTITRAGSATPRAGPPPADRSDGRSQAGVDGGSDQVWLRAPDLAVRPEPFGALTYDFATRRLAFVTDSRVSAVLTELDGSTPLAETLRRGGLSATDLPVVLAGLTRLEARGMVARAGAAAPGPLSAPGPQPTEAASVAGRSLSSGLLERCEQGLSAPICLTWELTYACPLSCRHCLSSSGRRDPRELTTAQCEAVVDELQRLQVFYVNIGGGEPTVRPDFWHLVEYAVARQVGVKFSTNGIGLTPQRAAQIAATAYVDVQVSLDGATEAVNDDIRGRGSYRAARRALANLAEAGFTGAKLSVVVTRYNVTQLDEFRRIADDSGAILRLTRLRPSGRGADVWDELHPTPDQQRDLYHWLVRAGDGVLTGDSFFHLAGLGGGLPGFNMCGAGRVVCLVDPIGEVFACPFAIHESFRAGNVLDEGGLGRVWRDSGLFGRLRSTTASGACQHCPAVAACRGGCPAAKFFTGLPLDGPDPECVRGLAEPALAATDRRRPAPSQDHSRARRPVSLPQPVTRACSESPLDVAASD